MEVRVGDERSGDVVDASFVEERLFELLEAGRSIAVAPEPPRGMQEIEVRLVDGDLAAQRHDPARAQQRQVEALAVVRRASAKRFDLGLDRLDERALVPDVVKQVLPQDELALSEKGDAKQEDVGTRSPSQ